ncbi:hypothetical protein, partial [Segatella copri]|uniref:hypothetical protein n=1 Tax=Segatella copri TaxID=165179 RepID=UPI001EE44D7F
TPWRLNNMLLKNQWVNEESRRKLKNTLRQMIMKTQPSKSMGCCKSSAQREVHSNAGLSQKRRKSQIDNLTHHLNELEKEEQKRPKVSRRKEIIKIKEEINKIEIQKTIEKINKTKSWFFEKVNKIDKPLARLTKKRREKTQIQNKK